MNFAPIYLGHRLVYKIWLFVQHWYADSFRFLIGLAHKVPSPFRYLAIVVIVVAYIVWALIPLLIVYYGISDFLPAYGA